MKLKFDTLQQIKSEFGEFDINVGGFILNGIDGASQWVKPFYILKFGLGDCKDLTRLQELLGEDISVIEQKEIESDINQISSDWGYFYLYKLQKKE